ncbi:MAG: ABC transporter ATP-binding protein [Polaromonas sp.]
MSFDDPIVVENASKTYRLFSRPSDRLWQALFGRSKAYYKEFEALSNIDFSLGKGEAFGIVGVNGAGKSTLLQLIAGTIEPTTGTVRSRGRIAALLELGSGFNTEFTGRENIYLNAATLGLGKLEIDQKIDGIIEFSGIGAHIDQPVKTYSSGMYVRLAFSIATSVEPDILIVDEALSVGDGAFARKSFDRIMQIKESGATVLFCSHTLFHIEVFCDRALWLHQGRIQEIGKVSGVLSRYQEFLDRLAEAPAAAVPPTAQDAVAVPQDHGEAQPAMGSAFAAPDGSAALPGASGFARIKAVRVQMNGHEGDELFGDVLASTLTMEIDFLSDPGMPSPSAAIVLSSDSGRILASSFAAATQAVFHRDAAGNGTARVTIEKISLNKGRYRVGAYLTCERNMHVYQWMDPVAHINLHHPGAEPGFFLIDACWASPAA